VPEKNGSSGRTRTYNPPVNSSAPRDLNRAPLPATICYVFGVIAITCYFCVFPKPRVCRCLLQKLGALL